MFCVDHGCSHGCQRNPMHGLWMLARFRKAVLVKTFSVCMGGLVRFDLGTRGSIGFAQWRDCIDALVSPCLVQIALDATGADPILVGQPLAKSATLLPWWATPEDERADRNKAAKRRKKARAAAEAAAE